MRWLCLFLFLPVLSSCGPEATLFSDEVFRAAAPEIVRAWAALPPWHRAKLQELPPGVGPTWWDAQLKASPPSFTALVGAVLTETERRELKATHPRIRFIFFVTPAEASDQETVTVARVDAWSTVAKAAAAKDTGEATVLFPSDVTDLERDRFAREWRLAGGRGLSVGIWPKTQALLGTGAVFQWAGAEADALVIGLSPSRPVHGNPGTAVAPGARGLTWKIKETGLGEFLWSAAENPGRTPRFLPLETEFARR